jgi:hypothetical protein
MEELAGIYKNLKKRTKKCVHPHSTSKSSKAQKDDRRSLIMCSQERHTMN